VKDEFLATLGHELRTPLAAIVGWAGMLVGDRLSDVAMRRAHGAIARNAQTLRVLIEDVLDVSRIVSGKLRLEMGPTDVVGPLRNALDAVRPAAEEKHLAIGVTFADDATVVWGDTGRLQQVFLNLLSNAVKFTQKGGRVDVEIRRVGGTVEVSVTDNGVGIEADVLPHVFERFRQCDSSTTRPQTGLGLGLAIVKHLVELHGGTVEAASGGIGQGAAFTVCLPYHPLQERRRVHASEPGREALPLEPVGGAMPDLGGVKVLIVDDQAETRELTASILAQSGAMVHTSATAKEALRQVETDTPQVLVVDISMPEMDGYAFLKAIRERNDAACDTPAIAFTAYASQADRESRATAFW
jgi:CheY-like chemotaxis protein